MKSSLIVGQPVIFIDEHRVERPALVKHVWPGMPQQGIEGCNLVFISPDEDRKDGFGRQIENRSSVVHISMQPGGGHAWKFPHE